MQGNHGAGIVDSDTAGDCSLEAFAHELDVVTLEVLQVVYICHTQTMPHCQWQGIELGKLV